jgi:hypothetical protein
MGRVRDGHKNWNLLTKKTKLIEKYKYIYGMKNNFVENIAIY